MKGTGGFLLYLDFDGCLHHDHCLWHPRIGPYLSVPEGGGYVLFQHAELLERALRPYPRVEIVLATAWVLRYGWSRTTKYLRPALRSRVIGATFHSSMNKTEFSELPRGVQVQRDVERRKPRSWVAIDDDFQGWPEASLDRYVRTHKQNGISDPIAFARLQQKLVEMFG
jgi:hypothetical protein